MEKMGRILNIAFLAAIAMATMLQSSSAQTAYVVGDALGWAIPPGPAVYTTWAANKTFRVGDTLVFNFTNGAHDVARVTKANYDACNSSSSLFLLSNSPANVTLNQTGDHYFLCAFPGHCSGGQKLAINVSAAASSPAPQPSTPAPQPSSPAPRPSTPPPASTPQPSAPAPAPQTGSPSPISAPTPAPSRSPVTPPSSSSPSPSTSPPPPSTATPPPSTATPPPPIASSSPSPTGDNGGATPPTPGNGASSLGVAGLSVTFLSFIVAFFV
ncbi:blue copper protein-like isoform X2 [Durio zibethinus]|uniref:Blue copper protein-like isoform X1 n=1 Tax=Durio zibethinus TaxID=66656 RepID=A0A6P5XR74_DURZI|nr:blue copper protein-like isoform X1 [Durio zibethinus]XP_022730713.1 blue copper protein-like isoform X2 [Durio zibethinus]